MDEHISSPVERIASLENKLATLEVQNARLVAENTTLQQLYERAPLGYQSLDENGSFLSVNQAWLDALGYSREEVVGQNFGNFLHPDWQDHFKINFPRFKAVGEILGAEFQMRKKDGSYIFLSFDGKIGKDPQGKFQQTYCIFQDITRQRQAEEALRRSEEKWRNIIVSTPQIGISIDRQGRIVFANTHFLQLTGWREDEVIGRDWFDTCIPSSIREEVRTIFLTVMEQKDTVGFSNYENEIVTRAGEIRNVAWSNVVSEDIHGNIIDVTCLGIDLTERKRMERQSLLLTDLIARSQDFIGVADPHLRAIYVNPAGMAMVGLDGDEAVRKTKITDYFFAEDLPFLERTILPALMTNGRWEGEFRFRHFKTGDPVYVMYDLFRTKDPETGAVTNYTTITRDITERKKSQKALEDASMRASLATKASGVGVWEYDIVHNRLQWDEQMYALYGITRETFDGAYESWRAGVHPEDVARCDQEVERSLCGEKEFRTEFRVVWPDGTVRHIQALATVLRDIDGKPLRMIGTNWDITERKQAEESLRKSEERFLLAMKASHDGIFDWNLETNEIYYSPAWKSMLGYEDHELPNDFSVWEKTTDPEDVKKSWELQRKLVSKEIDHFVMEFKMKHKDGHWVDILSRAEAMFNESGKAVRMVGTHTNITERKKNLLALQENRQLLQSMLEAVPDMVSVHDQDMTILYSNWKGFAAVPEEKRLIGTKCYHTYRGYNEICPDCQAKAVFQTGRSFETEAQLPDGRWLDLRVIPLQGLQGDTTLFLEWVRDITERKHTEEALRISEQLFSAFMANNPAAAWITDRHGVITYANPGYSKMFPTGDPTGRSVFDIYPESIAREYIANNERVLVEKRVEEVVESGLRADGSLGSFFVYKFPLRSPDGNLNIGGTALDITEQLKAEEALIRQQRIIQLNNQIANVFLTSSQDEVFADVLDVILKALESRFGYFGYIDEAGDLVCPSMTRDVWDQCQMTDKSIVFPRPSWGGLWGRSLREQQTLIANENLQVPQGHVALENALATPIVYNNTLIGQFVVANKAGGYDKDDRELMESVAAQTAPILFAIQEEARQKKAQEKLQAQLNQAQKMESVGRLAGGVAHDFNNMLGVILGYTDMAMERVESDDPLHTDLEKIQRAAQRSADLTRQLLAFARKQTVSPKVIDLNDSIEGILKLLRRLIGEDIDLAWQPGKAVWPVKIDPAQIDQILTNLCVNARDAIVDTGKVTIETGTASLDEEYCAQHAGFVPGEYVLLAVSDNGCGMDEETQTHLFEPFFTTKEVGKGTGLGLATVYGVVKQNHGFINVYSEPGQGTTFKIYLPRHLDKTTPLPEKEADKAGGRGHETVLLVEDEPAILEMTTSMLERLGYTVLAAGTPGEAIRLAQGHPGRIDLLFSDVVMPEMNGRDLAKNLLSIYPDIRRLFMSGYTANVIAHHGVLDHGVHFIHKPFSRNDLAAKIREALDQ